MKIIKNLLSFLVSLLFLPYGIYQEIRHRRSGIDDCYESSVEDIHKAVNEILEEPSLAEEEWQAKIDSCLEMMERELNRQRECQKGLMPSNDFFGGIDLAELASEFAEFFRERKDIENELRATSISTEAILTSAGHYHHIVGPAMLAFADVNERKGNLDKAKKAYSAIYQDFEEELEEIEYGERKYAIYGEDLAVAESLEFACKKLLGYEADSAIKEQYEKIINRVSELKKGEESPFTDRNLSRKLDAYLRSNGRIKCPTCKWNMVYRPQYSDACNRCGQNFNIIRDE